MVDLFLYWIEKSWFVNSLQTYQIGASTATCSISGSVRVEASRSVTFKRLKLEVGQDADSGEAVHVVR